MTDIETGTQAFDNGDYKTAFNLLLKFQDSKDVNIAYMMGYMYQMGLGVPQNYDIALDKYLFSSTRDHLMANFRMGEIYYHGLMCMPKDEVKAKAYFDKAANRGKGVPEAQYMMGLMSEKGQSGEPCPIHAHMWYNLAAANGHAEAAVARERIADPMTLKDIRQAQRLAFDWF